LVSQRKNFADTRGIKSSIAGKKIPL